MYFMRFMQNFFVEKNIGPKVIMIRNMVSSNKLFKLSSQRHILENLIKPNENSMVKGENAGNQYFLLLQECVVLCQK